MSCESASRGSQVGLLLTVNSIDAQEQFAPREIYRAILGSSDLWHLITDHGRVDVITLPAHLGNFEQMRNRAHEVPLGEIEVPIAHRDDLLIMKRAAARPQDLADVRLLESLDEES